MRYIPSLNIRNKLTLIIVFVSMTVMVLVGSVHFVFDIQHARQKMVQDLLSLTQLLGNRSSAALAFNISSLAEENLLSLQHMPNILRACVYKKQGELFASYLRDASVASKCPETMQEQKEAFLFTNEQLSVVSDIYQKRQLLGKIHITSNLMPINEMLFNMAVFSLLALVAAAFIAALLARWMQRFISKPIITITDIAKSIEQDGDHSQRVAVSGNDEVAQLARTFNAMLDALEKQNDQMHRSKKMDALGQLTGGIAHDYNNMLGVIMGYSELLEAALKESPLAKYAHEIQRAGDRGARLTKKLLSFSRSNVHEAGCFDINMLLLNMQHMLSQTLTARVVLVLELTEYAWPVWLNGSDFEDAVLNLCINAMHAIDGNGKLTIQTSNQALNESDARSLDLSPGHYVLLTFTDTGKGMDKSIQQHIFEPFYSTKGEMGTGLGLSQVYGFVKQNGGGITVISESGKGAQFRLYFPKFIAVMDVQKKTDELKSSQLDTANELILLVDDETALLDLISEILSRHGYKVITADNGQNALKMLKQHPVDLMISDIIMPEMSGYELARIVKTTYPSIKIQLVSGFSDDTQTEWFDEKLCKSILIKPFSIKSLVKRIQELLSEK